MSGQNNALHILVIDDEIQIRRLLQRTLEQAEYKVFMAGSGEEGLTRAGMDRPELIILDLGLPDMDGVEVLKRLREWSSVPVLILSVRDSEETIISALDNGADDYLTKPFRTGELLARVRTALRHRHTADKSSPFVFGALSVDLTARTVKKNGEVVKLTGTEYALLALFVRNAGRVLTHKHILEQIWGPAFAEETQYTRVYVGQLRKKLEEQPDQPRLFISEAGVGYRLAVEE